jgi:RNA polymerase sigma-70 factor (ECF subfamily)
MMELELLEQFVAGDLDAFESVFRQFQREVHGAILRIVRDPAAAEDLTLETFWRIYRARARFDPARGFSAWAHTIATNLAFTHVRRAAREVSLTVDVPAASPPDDSLHGAVRHAVAELPPRLRQVALAALIEERSYPEIAQALGISVEAVKSRQFRAVRLLRKKLKRMGVEP